MTQLTSAEFMKFPMKIGPAGAQTSGRADHVREVIEQVLFTNPGERVFRPEFGAGVQALVFEPNDSALWQITRKRLQAALAKELQGEVDPASLEIEVGSPRELGIDSGRGEEQLLITIRFMLATIGHSESVMLTVGGGS